MSPKREKLKIEIKKEKQHFMKSVKTKTGLKVYWERFNSLNKKVEND